MMLRTLLFSLLFLFYGLQCTAQEVSIDRDSLLRDVQILSSDALEGRLTGEVGNLMAQVYIKHRFEKLGLAKFGDTYFQYFDHVNSRSGLEFKDAANIIGYINGTAGRDDYLIIMAHYDHLGVRDGQIYNGADDNASGVGGLLAAAEWFSKNRPESNIIFAAWDAEEQGLAGARHFVDNPLVPLENISFVINMDMISTNFEDELYAVGTYHYPFLKDFVETGTEGSRINVLFGHDSPDLPPGDDWTMSSDHGPFHARGIPFIYFGVEDHPHYHQPSDVFENINPEFYVEAVRTILSFMIHADKNLPKIREMSGR